MYPVFLQFGNFELRSYGVIVALSFFIGLWLSSKEAKRKGIDPKPIQDFALYALLGGIIGARIYFVLFSEPAYYLKNPWEIFAVWHGGIGVIGSLFGGALVALWYCWKKGISFWKLGDTLTPGIALGQTVGQFACLFNGDSFGKPTDLPWAITYTDPRSLAPLNIPLHPIELYEMAAYFLVFLIVWTTRKKLSADGLSFLTYVGGYGIARFSVEFFRGNPAIFAWGIPAAHVFSVAMILASLLGFALLGKSQEKNGMKRALVVLVGMAGLALVPGQGAAQELSVEETLAALGKGPTLGKEAAAVTIVEFSDFQCSFCKKFWTDTLPKLKEAHIKKGQARFIYRNFAILGKFSEQAAQAAECAGEQGKFWEYHDSLFANQGGLAFTGSKLKQYARELKLDVRTFGKCLDASKYRKKVEGETAVAAPLGASGTPTFFVNGRLMVGAQPFEVFQSVIEEQLGKSTSKKK